MDFTTEPIIMTCSWQENIQHIINLKSNRLLVDLDLNEKLLENSSNYVKKNFSKKYVSILEVLNYRQLFFHNPEIWKKMMACKMKDYLNNVQINLFVLNTLWVSMSHYLINRYCFNSKTAFQMEKKDVETVLQEVFGQLLLELELELTLAN